MSNQFGLSDTVLSVILSAVKAYPEIIRAVVFGSRAIGNYKNGSDVDIAIFGKNADENIALHLSTFLNEQTTLPYKFDVISYDYCKSAELKLHIDAYGKAIME